MTSVSFANLTLSHLGSEALAAWPESGAGTTPGRTLSKHYESVRQTLLRAHRWHFAAARVLLDTEATVPAFGWLHAFDLPEACLRVNKVNDREAGTGEANWAIEGRQILTDDTEIELLYTADVTDITLWPASFTLACSYLLAAACCEALVASDAKKQMLLSQADSAIRSARGADHGEARPRVIQPWQTDKDGKWTEIILT